MTQIMPTLFVLFVSIFREGVEDYGRYKADNLTNNRKVKRVKANGSGLGQIEVIRSADVQAGDTLMIMNGEELPADIILIKSLISKQET